jgi:hypothetical protein
MLQHWMKSHQVGPEFISVTRKNKSRFWCTRLNILHWKIQKTPFWSPGQGRDGWCNQSFLQWFNMISRSKDLGYNASYYCNINIIAWSCYIIKLGKTIMEFTQWHEPHCQLDVFVTWSGNWSSVDHELVIEVYLGPYWFNTIRVSVLSN